jgi:hypothetical protein
VGLSTAMLLSIDERNAQVGSAESARGPFLYKSLDQAPWGIRLELIFIGSTVSRYGIYPLGEGEIKSMDRHCNQKKCGGFKKTKMRNPLEGLEQAVVPRGVSCGMFAGRTQTIYPKTGNLDSSALACAARSVCFWR